MSPCPNCGSTDIDVRQMGLGFTACCAACSLKGPRVLLSRRTAYEAWDSAVEFYRLIAMQIMQIARTKGDPP